MLVTASTGSFGKAVCLHLASKGYDLVIAGRNKCKLDVLKMEILSLYKNLNIQPMILDFGNLDSIKLSISSVNFDKLDGIILIGPRPILSKQDIPSSQEWISTFKETFVGPLEALRYLVPYMKDKGSIVIIAGNTSKDYSNLYANTNVIRLAWIGEVKNLMHFVAQRKIRINSISPGPVLTHHHKNKINKEACENNISFDEQLQRNTANIPLNTYGSLNDVAYLVYFLISNESSYINGSNIILDGGASNSY